MIYLDKLIDMKVNYISFFSFILKVNPTRGCKSILNSLTRETGFRLKAQAKLGYKFT